MGSWVNANPSKQLAYKGAVGLGRWVNVPRSEVRGQLGFAHDVIIR